jgi:hypothetical protein
MKRNRTPNKQQKRYGEDKKAILQGEIDHFANHLPLHRLFLKRLLELHPQIEKKFVQPTGPVRDGDPGRIPRTL